MSRDAAVSSTLSFSSRPSLGALATVLGITASRLLRGRRLWLFLLLFAAPAGLAAMVRRYDEHYDAAMTEQVALFVLFLQAIAPLAALLFGASMIQDDVDEQTLTYFLIRPIPRWLIYVVKALGGALATAIPAAAFAVAALLAARWGLPDADPAWLAKRAGMLAGLVALAVFVYVSIFGFLGILTKRALVVGVGYIMVFEGLLANIPFLLRYGTVMFHLRVLSVAWLGLDPSDWSINPAEAPAATTSFEILVGAAVVFLALGAWIFAAREFRVKTPEGS